MLNVKQWLYHTMTAIAAPRNDTFGPVDHETITSATNPNDRYEATVTRTIRPGVVGQVSFQGTWWNARCNWDVTLFPGQVVYITNRQGNTLYVEPGCLQRTMLHPNVWAY